FKTIGDTDLVVNVAQIILNNLLSGSQLNCNFLVLEALYDQSNNSQLFWRQAIPYAGSDDVVLGGFGCSSGVLYPGLVPRYFANAFHQRSSAHVAEDYASNAELQVLCAVVAAFDHDHQARLGLLRELNECANVDVHRCRKDKNIGAEAFHRGQHPLSVFAL